MAQTHDTIDGLLAEFRGYSAGMPASYHVTMSWADFRKMLDRFEAAHRREVATTKESLAVGNSGDCAKLREALVKIEKMAHCDLCNVYPKYRDKFNDKIGGIEREARAALAAPPRNCDVGTAKEQAERFNEFCWSHGMVDWAPRCEKCKFLDIEHCELAWAQKPYKEGGAK